MLSIFISFRVCRRVSFHWASAAHIGCVGSRPIVLGISVELILEVVVDMMVHNIHQECCALKHWSSKVWNPKLERIILSPHRSVLHLEGSIFVIMGWQNLKPCLHLPRVLSTRRPSMRFTRYQIEKLCWLLINYVVSSVLYLVIHDFWLSILFLELTQPVAELQTVF